MCRRLGLGSVRRRSNPDSVIAAELQTAGIPVVPKTDPHPACPLRVQGRLETRHGAFTFDRKSHYWEATGFVPLDIARALYYDGGEIGKEQIRAGGHRHSLPPEQFAVPRIEDRTALRSLHDLGLLKQHSADADETVADWDPETDGWESLDWETWPTFNRVADLCNAGSVVGDRFVGVYHIDSQAGVARVAEVIRDLSLSSQAGYERK